MSYWLSEFYENMILTLIQALETQVTTFDHLICSIALLIHFIFIIMRYANLLNYEIPVNLSNEDKVHLISY